MIAKLTNTYSKSLIKNTEERPSPAVLISLLTILNRFICNYICISSCSHLTFRFICPHDWLLIWRENNTLLNYNMSARTFAKRGIVETFIYIIKKKKIFLVKITPCIMRSFFLLVIFYICPRDCVNTKIKQILKLDNKLIFG